jgi:hypothetical protein
MKQIYLLVVFLITLFSSCTKEDIKNDADNLLIGTWDYSDYKNDVSIFIRSQEFTDNHCYRFNNGGTLIERKNSGWCGTPPISYADYQGTWEILDDTLILINVGYWDGLISYKLDIESVSSDSLKVITLQIGHDL